MASWCASSYFTVGGLFLLKGSLFFPTVSSFGLLQLCSYILWSSPFNKKACAVLISSRKLNLYQDDHCFSVHLVLMLCLIGAL